MPASRLLVPRTMEAPEELSSHGKMRVCLWNLFMGAWLRVEETGGCDTFGGAECMRVFKEWVDAGKPLPITPFIRDRSNLMAYCKRSDT